jgi:hypothetical protein
VPKFTQRHYIAVAELFWTRSQELRRFGDPPTLYQEAHWNEWLLLQRRFSQMFVQDNPRTEKNHPFGFKPEVFDKACGRKEFPAQDS